MSVRAARQVFLVGLALALWSALGRPGWLELLGCYLVALVLSDFAAGVQLLPSLPPRAWLALGVMLALPGLRFAYGARARIVEDAGLAGVTERLGDRFRLTQSPAIAPGLVSTAEPQSFFIHADSSAVRLQLAADVQLQAHALGAGLFRVDYDPRRDGVPTQLEGELPIRLHMDSGAVSRSLRVVTPLPHPRWFCRSPSGERAATVSEETDELIVVDARDARALRVSVGDGPLDCAFVEERVVAITHRHAPALWFVDIAASPAQSRKLVLDGPAGRLAWDASRHELVVARLGAEPGLWRVLWPELSLNAAGSLPVSVDWLAMAGDALIVSSRADASLRRLERAAEGFIERGKLELGRPVAALALRDAQLARLDNPDDVTLEGSATASDASHPPRSARNQGHVVFVTVTDFQPAHSPPQLGNHFVQDQLLVIDAQRLTLVQRVLTARRSERQTKPGDTDQGGSPLGLWPLRDGRVALTFAGTDELWKLALPDAEPESLRFADDFFTAHGVVELADGTLWLASPARGALARLAPGSRALHVVALAPSDQVLASARPDALARRLGERGFYESTRSGISCQSCHMHADSDFAAYNLGDHRLIPTLSVRGLMGTAPYLRDGSYPSIADLDEVAQTLYRGYVRQQPGRRYALQSFVASLPRALSQHARDLEAERRGYAVFRRAGCARCHTPPAFTNLGQLPMAALFPRAAAALEKPELLDVPSLLSVATAPPYLHDGRARSLRAVISDENPDNLHGDTRALSEAERADLLHFLSSL